MNLLDQLSRALDYSANPEYWPDSVVRTLLDTLADYERRIMTLEARGALAAAPAPGARPRAGWGSEHG